MISGHRDTNLWSLLPSHTTVRLFPLGQGCDSVRITPVMQLVVMLVVLASVVAAAVLVALCCSVNRTSDDFKSPQRPVEISSSLKGLDE